MTGRVHVIWGFAMRHDCNGTTQAVAAPKQVVADLSNSSVDITSSYMARNFFSSVRMRAAPGTTSF